jgi:hypothetical protein
MTAITATTKLDAVNIMLSHQGEEPYNSLVGETNAEVRSAVLVLDEILKETCSMGWLFNSEEDVVLTLNADSEIDVPATAVNITFPRHAKRKYTTRRNKLYNRDTLSHTFTDSVKVNLIRLMDFEDLPEVCRKYVTVKAGRVYQGRYLASETVDKFTERSEYEALTDLKEQESVERDANILDSPDVHAGVLGGRNGGVIRGAY